MRCQSVTVTFSSPGMPVFLPLSDTEMSKSIDPVGLSFEHFDAIGSYRTEYDNGVVVDATGTVPFEEGFVDVRLISLSA